MAFHPAMPPADAGELAAPHVTTVLAVDGNSLAHRAFHALVDQHPPPRSPLAEGGASRSKPNRSGDGRPTSDEPFVTRGVLAMLASAWSEGPFDAVVVAFDGPDNRRKADDAGYKANRAPTDARLQDQLVELDAHLARCGFAVVRIAAAEADDVLAAAADGCTARGWRAALLSSDRDLTALVSDEVRLLRPRSSMADLRCYDVATVVAEYGVRPEQYTDFAAMRGDPSDGLPGVRGIGAKTAARLLRDYGDIRGIYAALPDLPARLESALRAGRAQVERNLLLMAPIPHLHLDLDAAVSAGVDLASVEAVCDDLGVPGTASRLRAAVARPPLPPLPPPPSDEPEAAMPTPAVPARTPVAPISGAQQPLF